MDKDLRFEAFDENKGWFGKGPRINVLAKGGIGFSTSFMKTYLPENPVYAALRYASDDKFHYIGFSFTNNPDRTGTMKIFYPKKNYGMIQCVSFFKKYNIDYNRIHISIIGNIHEAKGQEFFCEISSLYEKSDKYEFLVVGDGSKNNPL